MEKVSIIIPVKDQLKITQVCLDSLRRYTDDYELILVDDGGANETKEYLEQAGADHLVRFEKSGGWCSAINAGDAKATGDFIVYMNNDVVLTPGWLEEMLEQFKEHPDTGIMGNTSNRVDGYQHIDFNKEGVEWQEVEALTGICLMLPRKVRDELIEKDGFIMDMRFGLGGQDDADLSYRVKALGYKAAIARKSFIYHYGSASFRAEFDNDARASQDYARSRIGLLKEKWDLKDDPRVWLYVFTQGTLRSEVAEYLVAMSHYPNLSIRFMNEYKPLANARNKAVEMFLEESNSPDDRMVFLDDDIVPPLNGLDILLKDDKDAISGLCLMLKHDDNGDKVPVSATVKKNKDGKYEVVWGEQGVYEIDACGLAFFMVKRKVLEDVKAPLFQALFNPDGTNYTEEDFNFCEKVLEAGFKIYADGRVFCSHIRPYDFKEVNRAMGKIMEKYGR